MIPENGFWYVGSPYSKYPYGLRMAFEEVCRATAHLAICGYPVYSPIAHSHPIAMVSGMDATNHDFWVKFDAPMVHAASGLIIVTMQGWQDSRGLAHEIEAFQAAGKPVLFFDPTVNPVALTHRP